MISHIYMRYHILSNAISHILYVISHVCYAMSHITFICDITKILHDTITPTSLNRMPPIVTCKLVIILYLIEISRYQLPWCIPIDCHLLWHVTSSRIYVRSWFWVQTLIIILGSNIWYEWTRILYFRTSRFRLVRPRRGVPPVGRESSLIITCK